MCGLRAWGSRERGEDRGRGEEDQGRGSMERGEDRGRGLRGEGEGAGGGGGLRESGGD